MAGDNTHISNNASRARGVFQCVVRQTIEESYRGSGQNLRQNVAPAPAEPQQITVSQ